MSHVYGGGHTHPPHMSPFLEIGAALEKGDALSGGVAGGGDRHCIQETVVDTLLDILELNGMGQQRPQGIVIQQGQGFAPTDALVEHRPEQATHALEHVQPAGPVHRIDLQVAPDLLDLLYREAKIVGRGRQRDGVNRPGGGTTDDGERIMGVLHVQVGDGLEYADLVRALCPSPGKNEGWFHGIFLPEIVPIIHHGGPGARAWVTTRASDSVKLVLFPIAKTSGLSPRRRHFQGPYAAFQRSSTGQPPGNPFHQGRRATARTRPGLTGRGGHRPTRIPGPAGNPARHPRRRHAFYHPPDSIPRLHRSDRPGRCVLPRFLPGRPFAVARSLLRWRDHWYLAGWRGRFSAGVPDRLRDMAAIEELAATEVAPGLGQRIQRVTDLLADNPVAIDSIALRDPLEDFGCLWQRLVQAMGARLCEPTAASANAPAGSDLHAIQEQLLRPDGSKLSLRGDRSFLVLRADSARASCALSARLVQRCLQRAPSPSLGILAEKRSDLLDEALEAIGAPRLGFSLPSSWRPVFQVLPLACELLWEPLNSTALFQFLSHPVGPLPARQRKRLAAVAAEVPGIGSEQWREALQHCIDREPEEHRSDHAQALHYWLECDRFDPQVGAHCEVLAERARRVGRWLNGAREASDEPSLQQLYHIALNQVQEFEKAIERLRQHGRERLTRDNVLRLIDDVRGSGAPVTDREAQVAPGAPRAYPATHAGAFHTALDTVIWWDCQATDNLERWPWSRGERAALAGEGVLLQSEEHQLAWLGRAWLRPVLAATGQCVLVMHDDVDRNHPLWEQLAAACNALPEHRVDDPATLEALDLGLRSLSPDRLPPRARWWRLPSGISLPVRQAESYSSLDTFIYSPYQWLLRYAARIRPGSLARVTDGATLKGNLAHHLFEMYFNSHMDIQAIGPGSIPNWVESELRALLVREGALLLEPGRQAECERFITVAQEALVSLVEHLQQAGAVSVCMESHQSGEFIGGRLEGYVDLLATRADGREAVVDIKWGGRRYRTDSLREGSYLQLATYAKLRPGTGAGPCLSYFIVQDAHMLNLAHAYFPGAERIDPLDDESLARHWQRVEHSWAWRRSQFDRGLVEVTVQGTEVTDDSYPGEGGLPMPEYSDSFNDYAVLTGWEDNA